MFGSIPDFTHRCQFHHPLPSCDNQNVSSYWRCHSGGKITPAEPLIYSQPHTQLLPHLSTNPHSNPTVPWPRPHSNHRHPQTTLPAPHSHSIQPSPCTRHICALVSSQPVASRAGRSCHLDPGRRAEMQLGRKWRGRKVGSLGSRPEDHGGGEVVRGSQREWGCLRPSLVWYIWGLTWGDPTNSQRSLFILLLGGSGSLGSRVSVSSSTGRK